MLRVLSFTKDNDYELFVVFQGPQLGKHQERVNEDETEQTSTNDIAKVTKNYLEQWRTYEERNFLLYKNSVLTVKEFWLWRNEETYNEMAIRFAFNYQRSSVLEFQTFFDYKYEYS